MIAGHNCQGNTVHVSMETYIDNACKILEVSDAGHIPKIPITAPINTETVTKLLEKWELEVGQFLTAWAYRDGLLRPYAVM